MFLTFVVGYRKTYKNNPLFFLLILLKMATGFQRFRCLDCKRLFQLDYGYEAYKPGVKEQIVDMAMNSSSVRKTGRVIKVGYNTMLRTLKNLTPKQVTTIPFDLDIEVLRPLIYRCE